MAGDAERLVVLLEARIRDFEKNMQKASGTADKSFGRMRRESRSATRQMEADMSRASRRINQALASTSTQIGVLSRSFAGAFAGGIFAGGLAGLQRGVSNLLSEMSKIADVAKTVGMGTEDLQRLRYAFEQTGVTANETDLALRRFARRTGEAASGSGQLYEVLKANNVELRNADGSMRGQMDLLRDYARLIQNAGSHQERLALAFKAFDVAGAGMVQGLMEDFDGFIGKIDEAGGAIDDELIQRAAELDTRMATAWSNFEKNAKSAVLTVITFMDDMADHPIFGKLGGMFALADFVKDPSWRNLSNILFTGAATDAVLGAAGGGGGDPAVNAAQRRVETLRDQIENLKKLGFDATEAERELAIAQAELERLVREIVAGGVEPSKPGAGSSTKTIIPGGADKKNQRDRAAEAALREQQAVLSLIDALSHELSLIGESDLAKAKANAIRQAGAAATDKQRENIEALVTAIHEENEALAASERAINERNQALQAGAGMAIDALLSVAEGSATAEEAMKRLLQQVLNLIFQMLVLKPLMQSLGGLGGGGLLGGLFPAAPLGVGLYASGTANTGGRRGQPRGIVHGQEAVIPLPSGGKVPVQLQGSGPATGVETKAKVEVEVFVNDDGTLGAIARQAGAEGASDIAVQVVEKYDRARQKRYQAGGLHG